MRRLQVAFGMCLVGLGLAGCVDEGAYTGPRRYEAVAPRDYRRYDGYERRPPVYRDYDRYDRYGRPLPIDDRYDPRSQYDPYDRPLPPPRRYDRYDRVPTDDGPRSYRPPVRDRTGFDRSSYDRPSPIQRGDDRPGGGFDRPGRDRAPPPGDGGSPRQTASQPSGSATTSTVLNQSSGLTQVCTGQGADQKCQLRINRPPR